MSFHELFGDQRTFVRRVLPDHSAAACPDCGRSDFANRSATDEAAVFFEDNEALAMQWHHLIAHDYTADLIEAMLEIVRAGLDDEGPLLAILGELAVSYFGLALQLARTGQAGYGITPRIRVAGTVFARN
jgi:hypothetical protein